MWANEAARFRKGLAAFSLVVACVVALLFIAWLQVFVDPLDLGTATSERFSWETFAHVKPGMAIREVTQMLGDPVRTPEAAQ